MNPQRNWFTFKEKKPNSVGCVHVRSPTRELSSALIRGWTGGKEPETNTTVRHLLGLCDHGVFFQSRKRSLYVNGNCWSVGSERSPKIRRSDRARLFLDVSERKVCVFEVGENVREVLEEETEGEEDIRADFFPPRLSYLKWTHLVLFEVSTQSRPCLS